MLETFFSQEAAPEDAVHTRIQMANKIVEPALPPLRSRCIAHFESWGRNSVRLGDDSLSNEANVTKLKRIYSPKTLKVLFALSGNQCAHPECTNTLIEPATEKSNAVVTAHICHIYAIIQMVQEASPDLPKRSLILPRT